MGGQFWCSRPGDLTDTPRKRLVRIVKGLFRWVTAKVHHPEDMVQIHVGTAGIRGMDVAIYQDPDGSGWIKLYQGAIVLEPYDDAPALELTAPAMLTFDPAGRVTGRCRYRKPLSRSDRATHEGSWPESRYQLSA
jgi:hypothetical protein